MVLRAHGGDSQVLHHVRGMLPSLGVRCQQWDGGGSDGEQNKSLEQLADSLISKICHPRKH